MVGGFVSNSVTTHTHRHTQSTKKAKVFVDIRLKQRPGTTETVCNAQTARFQTINHHIFIQLRMSLVHAAISGSALIS